MASCSQVSSLLQAYIDEELGNAEKCILEQHLAECSACRDELCEQKDCSDQIMDVLAGQRLQWGIRSRVLAHLPEMDPAPNHGSHPTDPQYARKRQRTVAFFPRALMAAAALVVVAGLAYIYGRTETLPPSRPAMGMVTFCDGKVLSSSGENDQTYESVALKSVVRGGDHFDTYHDGRLAISLVGRSMVKANVNSGFTVQDNRRVSVGPGQTYFDVGRDSRRFDVETPNGDIIVVGTEFVVDVGTDETKVTVREGAIIVSNGAGRTSVSEGQQLVFRIGEPLKTPYAVNADAIAAWADAIIPDPDALALFRDTLEQRQADIEAIPQDSIHRAWNLKMLQVDEIQLSWKPDDTSSGHCGYFVKVTDQSDVLRYVDFLDSSRFNTSEAGTISLKLADKPLTGVDELQIRLTPDTKEGTIETDITVSVVVTRLTPPPQ